MPTKHQLAYGIEDKESGKIVAVYFTRSSARASVLERGIAKHKLAVVELRKMKKKA